MVCKIWGPDDDNHEDYSILGFDIMHDSLKIEAVGCSKMSVNTHPQHFTAPHPRTQYSSGNF